MGNLIDTFVPPHLANPTASDCHRKVAIYCRVSTEEQAEMGNSLEAQERECREYARQLNRPVLDEVFRDEGVSAYNNTLTRPGLRRALAAARAAQADILVRDYSRFGRNADEMHRLQPELRDKGVEVLSVKERFDQSTLTGRMMTSQYHYINEMESERIGDRTLSGMRQNFRTRDPETRWCYKNGGSPPFGYKSKRLERGQRVNGKVRYKYVYELDDTVHNGKQVWQWLRHALVELRLKRGASYAEIVRFLNSIGLPPPRNKKGVWNISTIQEICRWDRLLEYTGVGLFNRTAQGKSTRRQIGRREKPWEHVDQVPDAHPAIISMEEAQALNELTKSRRVEKGHTNRVVRSEYLLTGGVSACAVCGGNVVGHGTKRDRRYVCGTYKSTRGGSCQSNRSVRCELVDERLIEYFHKRYSSPTAVGQLQRALEDQYRQTALTRKGRRQEVERLLDKVDREIERMLGAIKAGAPPDVCAATLQQLKEEKRQLEAEREKTPREHPPALPDLQVLLGQFRARFRKASAEVKRRMVRAFVQKVEFDLVSNMIVVHQYRRPELTALASDANLMNWIQVGSGGLLRRYSQRPRSMALQAVVTSSKRTQTPSLMTLGMTVAPRGP